MRRLRRTSGLTLVEMLAVLLILAMVAGMAVTATEGLVDKSRFEAGQRLLGDIEEAILGPRNAKEPDGTLIVSGFLADLGRLPRAWGTDPLHLSELWSMPPTFGLRSADSTFLSDPSHADPDVVVPCGWRGPYLRLPFGTPELVDPWGKRLISPLSASSPPDPDGIDYGHLRTLADVPVASPADSIQVIRLQGANKTRSLSDQGYDLDTEFVIPDTRFQATLSGKVSVRSNSTGALVVPPPTTTDTVVVKVFGPDPDAPGKIKVFATAALPFPGSSDFREFTIPGLTIGLRVVRAYFTNGGATSTTNTRSTVLQLTLLPGANNKDLVIDRP